MYAKDPEIDDIKRILIFVIELCLFTIFLTMVYERQPYNRLCLVVVDSESVLFCSGIHTFVSLFR